MASKIVKSRNWIFVTYPESMPENWQEILQQTYCPIAVSPLHDKDTDPTGEIKKSHYHNILCFAGPTTFRNVRDLLSSLNCPDPQVLSNVRGYYRYFTHKDNPEKFQYDSKDILHINGFCPDDYFDLTRSEQYILSQEIMEYVRENKIYEYADLMELLMDQGLQEYYNFAFSHTFFFTGYMRSRRERLQAQHAEARGD